MKNIDNITISTIIWRFEDYAKNEKVLTNEDYAKNEKVLINLFKGHLTGKYSGWCPRFDNRICDSYRNCADCQQHTIEIYAKKYKKLFSIFRGELNG